MPWSGGPYFLGFWMLPLNFPLRTSFDPSASVENLSLSLAYQKSFSILNEAFFTINFKGIFLNVENLYTDLEGEYSGTYNELISTLGYSREMLQNFRMGISVSYLQMNTPREDLRSMRSFALNIGARFHFYEDWLLGVFVRNLNSPEVYGLNLPMFLGAYFSYKNTSFGVLRDQLGQTNFGFGSIWRITDALNFLASMRYDGRISAYYLGFSIGSDKISGDYVATFHPDLPLSNFFCINYK